MKDKLFVVWWDNEALYDDHDNGIICICESLEDAKTITHEYSVFIQEFSLINNRYIEDKKQ